MASKGLVTLPVLRMVRRLGANGGLFQSADVRERLEYATQSVEAERMHAVLYNLKESGIIEVVNGSRQRYQHFRVADEDKLRRRIERAVTPDRLAQHANGDFPGNDAPASDEARVSEPHAPAPKRVMYLEERVADLEEQLSKLSGLPAEVGGIRSELRETSVKLDQLIELWS